MHLHCFIIIAIVAAMWFCHVVVVLLLFVAVVAVVNTEYLIHPCKLLALIFIDFHQFWQTDNGRMD